MTYTEVFCRPTKRAADASFLGAATPRVYVMGYEDRAPTPEELEQMRGVVRQAMEEGALGIASALIYPPGAFAGTEELIEMAKVVAEYDGLYISHLRSEGPRLIEAVDEFLADLGFLGMLIPAALGGEARKAGAFLAAGDAGADEQQAFFLQFARAPDAVGEMTVAAVNNDVPIFQGWKHLVDKRIHRLTRFDHDHHFARFFEYLGHFFDCMAPYDFLPFGPAVDKIIHLLHRSIDSFLQLVETFHMHSHHLIVRSINVL